MDSGLSYNVLGGYFRCISKERSKFCYADQPLERNISCRSAIWGKRFDAKSDKKAPAQLRATFGANLSAISRGRSRFRRCSA